MSVRALALDLDGTLLGSDYRMSDRTVAAVSAFRDSGRAVVIATGRARRSALPWARRLGGVSAMVCHNGAAVYDFGAASGAASDGDLLSETILPTAVVRRVIELSRRLDMHFHVFAGDDWYYETWRPGTAVYEGRSGFSGLQVDFDSLPELRYNKTLFIARTDAELETLTDAARDACAGEASLVSSGTRFLESVPRGVTKATGLGAWLATRGLTLADAMAIGDADNDREMILETGLGVAMAEAPADLRGLAAFVTGGVAEDGAADAIGRFLAGRLVPGKAVVR